MIDLKYSLVIEATTDPNFLWFYSPILKVHWDRPFVEIAFTKLSGEWKKRRCFDEQTFRSEPNDQSTVVIQNERRLEPAA